MISVVLWILLGVVVGLHLLTYYVSWRAGRVYAMNRGGAQYGWLWSTAAPNQPIGSGTRGRLLGRMRRLPYRDDCVYAIRPLNVIYRFWRHMDNLTFAPWKCDDGMLTDTYWKRRALVAEARLQEAGLKEGKDAD